MKRGGDSAGCAQVGFLTLLEALHYCQVGEHLKRPTWPIWVVGSESCAPYQLAPTWQVHLLEITSHPLAR